MDFKPALEISESTIDDQQSITDSARFLEQQFPESTFVDPTVRTAGSLFFTSPQEKHRPFLDINKRVVAERLPELVALMNTKSLGARKVALRVLQHMDKLVMAKFTDGFVLIRDWLHEILNNKDDCSEILYRILYTLMRLPPTQELCNIMAAPVQMCQTKYMAKALTQGGTNEELPIFSALSIYANGLLLKWKNWSQSVKPTTTIEDRRRKTAIIDDSSEPSPKRMRFEVRPNAPLGTQDLRKRRELEMIARESQQPIKASGVEEPELRTDELFYDTSKINIPEDTIATEGIQTSAVPNLTEIIPTPLLNTITDSAAGTVPPPKPKKRKRVSWAPDDKIASVRLFNKNDIVTKSSSLSPELLKPGAKMTHQQKKNLAAQKERDHITQLRMYEEEHWNSLRTPMRETVKWTTPRYLQFQENYTVKKEGQDSIQASIQEEYTGKEHMAQYMKQSDIPVTPKEIREVLKNFDDSEILIIPFKQKSDLKEEPATTTTITTTTTSTTTTSTTINTSTTNYPQTSLTRQEISAPNLSNSFSSSTPVLMPNSNNNSSTSSSDTVVDPAKVSQLIERLMAMTNSPSPQFLQTLQHQHQQ